MEKLPFEIPESLSVYLEQFEKDPLKTTSKLKNHLNRRGPDAVGYFLLAWFYHLREMNDTAIEYALAAKTFAPGSKLMENLHYYLTHPDTFNAWIPDSDSNKETVKKSRSEGPEPILDLENLIDRLSKVENKRIRLSEDGGQPEIKAVEGTDQSDEIISETLAKIHETQGKTKEALRIYEKLIKLNPGNKDKYEKQISRLEKKIKKEEDTE